MAKIHSSSICLLASIFVNVLLLLYVYNGRNQLSWSRTAAEEAEAVAAISCSGHGRAYIDGLTVDGKPVCECNACYRGYDCSERIYPCLADADSGDPLFLEPFWIQHAATSAVLASGWHRMSYVFPDQSSISQELVNHIHKVHAIAKNAVIDGKYIIFGAGSTQLINAAVFALSSENSSSPSRVVASTPYYPLYKSQTNFFQTAHFEFLGDTSLVKNYSGALNVIEVVTSPNNPDGQLKRAVLRGPSVKTIYDHAYYWPHFTAIPAPVNGDVMIFTISKLSGHAGSRFGWAIIKDLDVYTRMSTYIVQAEIGISRDTQLRALKLLQVILAEDDGKEIFRFAYKTMADRWKRLNRIISTSKCFSLQEISHQYCNFFNKVREPSPAYAWLKCENEEDADCTRVLRAANIIGRQGSVFNVEDRYVRLSLLMRQDDFEMLLYRLNELVKKEYIEDQAM